MTQYYRTNVNYYQTDCLSSSNEMNNSDCSLGIESKRICKIDNSFENGFTKYAVEVNLNTKISMDACVIDSDCPCPPISFLTEPSFPSECTDISSPSSSCNLSEFDEDSDDEMECSVCDSCDSVNAVEEENEVTSNQATCVSTNPDQQLYASWCKWLLACNLNNQVNLLSQLSGNANSQAILDHLGQHIRRNSQNFPENQFNFQGQLGDYDNFQVDMQFLGEQTQSQRMNQNLSETQQDLNQFKSVNPFAELGGGNCLTVADFMPSQFSNDQNRRDYQYHGSDMFETNELDVLAFKSWLNNSD